MTGPVPREMKKMASSEAVERERVGAEEAEECRRNGEGGADGGDEVEGLRGFAGPALGDDASGDGAAEAGDYSDGSHDETG